MTDTSITSVGPYRLTIETTAKGISSVRIAKEPLKKSKNTSNIVVQFMRAMSEFNKGNADAFKEIRLDAMGTPFQRKVWDATLKIPYGETRTYAQIAAEIGSPNAVRAVGTALGRNPVCVIVPCHRVVPSSGGIGNYAYGKAMKKWLLDHEAGRKA